MKVNQDNICENNILISDTLESIGLKINLFLSIENTN